MADNETKWVFDLDVKEAVEGVLNLKGTIESLADAKGTEGLVEGLLKVGAVAGTVGAALFTLKEAFDLTLEGENLRRISTQFETLAGQAGVVGSELREAMVGASKGMMTETEAMQAGSKALVEMGHSASRLPELMELARKASLVFGGDVRGNFEAMSNAIAAGNTRALKHMGIIIDLEKATKDYAAQIGVAESAMSAAEKSQAILNAALAKGKDTFKDIGDGAGTATTTWQQFKVTIEEVKETFVLAFEKTMGPAVRNWLKGAKDAVTDFKQYVTANFGEGVDQAAAKSELLVGKIQAIKAELIDIEQRQMKGTSFEPGLDIAKAQALTLQLKEYQAELEKTKAVTASLKETEEQSAKARGEVAVKDTANQALRTAALLKYQESAVQADLAQVESELKTTTTLADYDAAYAEKKLLLTEQTDIKIAQLAANKDLTEAQRRELAWTLEQANTEKLIELDTQLEKARISSLDRARDKAVTVADAIEAKWKLEVAKMSVQSDQFKALTDKAFDSVVSNGISGLEELGSQGANALFHLGQSSKSAAEVLRDFMIGALADIAEASGKFFIAKGIAELAASEGVNPGAVAEIAAGGGLVVLSGALKALSKSFSGVGGGSSGGASAGGGGGGGGSSALGAGAGGYVAPSQSSAASAPSSPSVIAEAQATEAPRKTVNLVIQGHLFETDATRRRLTEMIREESDATDFKIQSVGGGL